jgi:hypothetical protein
MKGFSLAAVGILVLAGSTSANLTPRKDAPPPHTARVLERTTPTLVLRSRPEYRILETTEVWLDGRRCPYTEVPGHAAIVRMEVAVDNRPVLRVFFRSGK